MYQWYNTGSSTFNRRISIILEQAFCETVCGKFTDGRLQIFGSLSNEEFDELNKIGYSGKTSDGKRISRADYLNTLGKGEWSFLQTKGDSGDFTEMWVVTHWQPNS